MNNEFEFAKDGEIAGGGQGLPESAQGRDLAAPHVLVEDFGIDEEGPDIIIAPTACLISSSGINVCQQQVPRPSIEVKTSGIAVLLSRRQQTSVGILAAFASSYRLLPLLN